MLKLTDLAKRPDFRVGSILISPSRRLVEGPAGRSQVEPLVMQVFLLLLDAKSEVVTRQELFDQIWGGTIVGDDSLNRVISGVRRIAAETAPDLFVIETIPRTGYRLIDNQSPADTVSASTSDAGGIPRRTVVAGTIAAVATAAGGLGLWLVDSRKDREFDDLIGQGERALDSADPASNAEQHLRRAVALRPRDAKANGLLAYALAMRADNRAAGQINSALLQAEAAVRAAHAVDPHEPNAQLANIVLRQSMLDFAATEDAFRKALAAGPDNIRTMRQLWAMLQCVGRSRDALAMIERALAVKPLAAGNHYPRAQLLWILGRTAEADRVIDRALEFWPTHRFVRFARFTILAFTGRERAALAMLENPATAPQQYTPEAIALWRVSLTAMMQRSPLTIAAAARANAEVAKKNLELTNQAVSVLSWLGELDAAFEIANGYFAVRERQAAQGNERGGSTAWRFAPWLFTPPTAPMRADPRFNAICDAIGLTEYWEERAIRPDYQLGLT